MDSISASFGDYGLFCAIDASGKQAVICWDTKNRNSTNSNSLRYPNNLPPMAALSGGEGFLCGILANTSQAFCWDSKDPSSSSDLVLPVLQFNAYSHIAAGKDHVCAVRGSYYSENDFGSVDCWDIIRTSNDSLSSKQSARFYDQLKIAMQSAKGLEYLHKEAVPPIVHRDVKSSKVLLDADWGARIADFGLLTPQERGLNEDMSTDVYNFGIVLLEILSGRKPYDADCTPPNVVDWAVPLIRQGKAAAIIDRYVALPRNVEPLLKLADIAELALKEDPKERATISELALLLDQIVKDGLIL
ncbi:serine threonine- kinase CCR1 [Olea europaea subsp. europaea]|nr:serine threonine- kinase CCR1 [Olea europaea subsp. europaea]